MMTLLPTMIKRPVRAAVPEKSAWLEAWGYLLCGFGVYLGLACYTFNPLDYSALGLNANGVQNLCGPYGAIAGARLLGRFGVIGMVWPLALILWGALTATGFVLLPRPRRLLGFMILIADASGFASVILPRTGLPQPAFGFGGHIGYLLKHNLMPHHGFGGALTALTVMGIIGMVLTDNLRLSRTAELAGELLYMIRRGIRRAWQRLMRKDEVEAVAPAASAGSKKKSLDGADVGAAPDEAPAKVAAPAAKSGLQLDLFYDGPAYQKPDGSLFSRSKKGAVVKDFSAISANLVQQLAEFKINGEIMSVTQGPVVTTFEFKPAPGTKVSKISALGDDLARMLKAQSLRVLAPIPGKDTVGFEVPNAERGMIGFGDLLDHPEFRSQKRKLPIAMGVDIFGEPVIADMAEMPHLLVAGSTGSGKSVFMNTLIGSLVARHSAATLRFVMIDPKMVEMAAYNGLPHMACPVITDAATGAKAALQQLAVEMDDRYKRMLAVGARNIDSFNETIKSRKKSEFLSFEGRWAPMPYIVLIIDEMADMMMMLGKEAEMPITRIAQKARAAGIHMVIATQRPSAEVVTGLIKANFPTRVAFRVLSGIDSRTILDQQGAENLLGKGDMLFLNAAGAQRLHGAYLSEAEVQNMVKTAKSKKK